LTAVPPKPSNRALLLAALTTKTLPEFPASWSAMLAGGAG
jgi:hypothetical protein